MTPAEELAQAADNLDALWANATNGLWIDRKMGSEGSTVFAGGQTVNTSRRVARAGEFGDAAYIAAMGPLVGKALADWLRTAARNVARHQGWDGEAVILARLINGSES
jgi:hypothetical protein